MRLLVRYDERDDNKPAETPRSSSLSSIAVSISGRDDDGRERGSADVHHRGGRADEEGADQLQYDEASALIDRTTFFDRRMDELDRDERMFENVDEILAGAEWLSPKNHLQAYFDSKKRDSMGDIDTEYLRSLFEQLTYSKI
jgi:hypothetical protein